jgi:hypothetical protein
MGEKFTDNSGASRREMRTHGRRTKRAPALIRLNKINLLLRRRTDRRTAGRPVQVGDRYKGAEP